MHTINGHLIVELPEGAERWMTDKDTLICSVNDLRDKNSYWFSSLKLPHDNYTILCTLQEALDSEELAGKIVERQENGKYRMRVSEHVELINESAATVLHQGCACLKIDILQTQIILKNATRN